MRPTLTPEERQRKIQEHQKAIEQLQSETSQSQGFPPEDFYWVWHLMVGITLGGLAALVSLGLNVVGAPLFGEPALELIRVYLTFPMGERALQLEEGMALTIGSGLYLCTGALLGIGFHLILRKFRPQGALKVFAVASVLGLGLWIVNFYGILSWLQPALLGGNWIISEIPIWVAALTHLIFAWTIAGGEVWGNVQQSRGI